MFRSAALLATSLLAVGACTSARESSPDRTATEQLLISTAIDRAVEKLDLRIPRATKVFVDGDAIQGPDASYATGAVKDRILRNGAHLVPLRSQAEAIVELRAGALSVDDEETLVGIPEFDVPVPLAGPLETPELSLYKQKERKGVAKLSATSYALPDGRLVDSSGPQFGYSHEREETLVVFSWRTTDLPEEEEEEIFDMW